MQRGLWIGVVAVALAVVVGVGQGVLVNPAVAYLYDSEFEEDFIQPTVDLSYDGYWAWLAGYVSCTQDERVEINAWIVQPSTGAEAEGNWHNACEGEPQLWNTGSIPSQNSHAFEEGVAEVCATARTRSNSGTTDIFQGCRDVEVAPTA